MIRSRILLSLVVCAIAVAAVAAPAVSHVPKANTRAAVQAYVQDAAKVVQKSGPSCATFASPEWKSGDYYIFVSGPDNKSICHPNAAIVGKSMDQITNAKGDKVGERINKAGMTSGGGWADYLWARPGQKTEEPKSTYVMRVKGPDGKEYGVGAGGWNLK